MNVISGTNHKQNGNITTTEQQYNQTEYGISETNQQLWTSRHNLSDEFISLGLDFILRDIGYDMRIVCNITIQIVIKTYEKIE